MSTVHTIHQATGVAAVESPQPAGVILAGLYERHAGLIFRYRPDRKARSWPEAADEIVAQAGAKFDPEVVSAFREHEETLRRVYYEVSTN